VPSPAIALGTQPPVIDYSRSDTLHPTAQPSSIPFPISKAGNTEYRFDGHVTNNSIQNYVYANSNYIHPLPYSTGLSPYQLAQLPVDSQHTFISTKLPTMIKDVANSTALSKPQHTNSRNPYPGAMNASAWPTSGIVSSFGGHHSSQFSPYGGAINNPI